jgi:hypothetical protein
MSSTIRSIIQLAGGFDAFRRLEITPTGKAPLIIERSQSTFIVTAANRLTFEFLVIPDPPRRDRLVCEDWPESADSMLRRDGYVEAALNSYLKRKQPTIYAHRTPAARG